MPRSVPSGRHRRPAPVPWTGTSVGTDVGYYYSPLQTPLMDVGEPNTTPSDTLNGWKEIAGHLARSVRTAQRWEAELGLPVQRITTPDGGQIVRGSRHEIENWLRQAHAQTRAARDAIIDDDEPEPDEPNVASDLIPAPPSNASDPAP